MRKLYAGLDVSLEMTSICVADAEGGLVFEGKTRAEPQAIRDALAGIDGVFERVGFEAGPLSPWLFLELKRAGLPAVCIGQVRLLLEKRGALAGAEGAAGVVIWF
jgi:transposase